MILLGDNENDVYDAIEDNDGKIKVPNIILFLQKDMDGRNTPLCMQMQRSTINEYNADYDTGVQNVFSFIFHKSHTDFKEYLKTSIIWLSDCNEKRFQKQETSFLSQRRKWI